jgi:hypothetical protein
VNNREALETLRGEYIDEIRRIIRGFFSAVETGEEYAGAWIADTIWESEWTKGGRARIVLCVSDHAEDCCENWANEDLRERGKLDWHGLACCAMRLDMVDFLGGLGVNLEEPATWRGKKA